MTGTVRWFEPRKGFGFIHPDDGMADVFVHVGCMATAGEGPFLGFNTVTQALEPGDKVQFDVVEAPCGRQAAQVRRVEA